MSGPWTITNRGSAGAAATASQAAPTSGLAQGVQLRLRALSASLAGSAAGADQLVVRDGVSGTGGIIWQWGLLGPANGADRVVFDGVDLLVFPRDELMIRFVAGVTSDPESVKTADDN